MDEFIDCMMKESKYCKCIADLIEDDAPNCAAGSTLSYPVNALRSLMSHSLTEILRIPSLGKFALESTFKK